MIEKAPRRKVELPNFSEHEGTCSCGCGKRVSDDLMLRLQMLVFRMSVAFNAKVTCVITGGARCLKKQADVYKGKDPVPTSYHTGIKRDGEGDSAAVDVKFFCNTSKYGVAPVRREVAALAAKQSNLFGGVIHKLYDGDNSEFIHLDMGPVREL